MIALNNDLLAELGLAAMPDTEKQALLAQMRERLELNVGTQLASRLSEAQLDEFTVLADNDDQEGALKWLQTNCPDYQQVVNQEFEKLKKEIAQSAPAILESVKPQ
jgi:hypothetical protein